MMENYPKKSVEKLEILTKDELLMVRGGEKVTDEQEVPDYPE